MDTIRDTLRFQRAGQFFLLTGDLTDGAVTDLFDAAIREQNQRIPAAGPQGVLHGPLAANANIERRDIRRVIAQKQIEGHAVDLRASLFVRSYAHAPVFAPRSGLIEYTFAYLFVVELSVQRGADRRQYLFVQRDGAIDPMKHGFSNFTEQIDFAAFLHQFIDDQPGTRAPTRIERMAMRMMASAQGEIRQKIIDSYDVAASTSSLGLHRTIAGNMTVTRQAGAKSQQMDLSPHRHRVRTGASRISYEGLLTWISTCTVGFFSSRNVVTVASPFLAQMAQPLLDLVDKVPSSLFIERQRLNSATLRFMASTGKVWEPDARRTPAGWTLEEMIEHLSEPMRLDPTPRDRSGNVIAMNPLPKEVFYFPDPPLTHFAGNDPLKVRVTTRTCKVILPKGAGRFALQNGQVDPTPLDELLNETITFRVVFENGSALFCSEGAFRSSNLELATNQLTKIFRPVNALANVETEKGNVAQRSRSFSPSSAFFAIENDVALSAPTSVLICDDSTDEWCDYLELDAMQPRMRWIHAKVQRVETPASRARRAQQERAGQPLSDKEYGPVSLSRSLSASDLQEVVGQATKNLSRLRISSSEATFDQRCQRWLVEHCSLPRASSIARVRRGAVADLNAMRTMFDTTASDPMAVYEVALVVPNYSAAYLTAELGNIRAGTAGLSTIQAFWLLSGFMHACLEIGARPLIFMQP
ncbi:hypothetical protein ACN9MU_00020 [Pseudoduganella sp. R-32]|uniref:hypothetical protein n=1 Tax=Pseudoduganella sp. R-32 TaxID=3404061 RepID=UPI003CF321AF